ncbi:MAG: MerC domain-containing protein [Myxococcota bacterium]
MAREAQATNAGGSTAGAKAERRTIGPSSAPWDRVGAFASGLCAVHCAAGALAPALFVLLGLELLMGEGIEWMLTSFAILFAVGALFAGWRKHRSLLVVGAFVLGIAGLLTSRGLEMSGHQDHAEHDHHGVATHVNLEAATHDHHGGDHRGGAWFGIVAGVFLVGGHALNIRASRQHEKSRCA